MAPEETRTISFSPPLRPLARTSTRASTRSASRPPDAVVSDEEPTLTTILRASATPGLAACTAACLAADTLYPNVPTSPVCAIYVTEGGRPPPRFEWRTAGRRRETE